MLMNDLLKDELFGLLSVHSSITNEELQNAYGCFIEQVKIISQSQQDYSKAYRILHFTRIEFKALQTLLQYGQGEKCP